MNIPFPILTPRLVDPLWFNADSPCDEESELTALEQANQHWVRNQQILFIDCLQFGPDNSLYSRCAVRRLT